MPVIMARGVGLHTRRGWMFRDVDLDIDRGDLVALTGPAGSGRTSLLLALAGYFKTNAGTLTRSGTAALGWVPGVNDPETGLTATEHAQERLLLLGAAPRGRRALAARGAELVADLPGTALGRELGRYERHRLMLRLATIGGPALIAVDDVDVALSADERALLWRDLSELAERGHAVLVSCRELEHPATEYRMEGK